MANHTNYDFLEKMLYVLTWRCIVPSPPPNTSPKLHFYIKHFPIQKILSFNPDWSLLSKVQFYLEELEIYRSIHYSVPLYFYTLFRLACQEEHSIKELDSAWRVEHINSLTSNNQTASFRADYQHPRGGVASADSCELHDTFWVDIQHMSTNDQNCFHHRYYHY